MAYRVVLAPAASRALDKQRGASFVALRGAILALAIEPRPGGAAKLAGGRNLWRIRLHIDGRPWRVVYQVRDDERLIIITRVVRRDEGTYRGPVTGGPVLGDPRAPRRAARGRVRAGCRLSRGRIVGGVNFSRCPNKNPRIWALDVPVGD